MLFQRFDQSLCAPQKHSAVPEVTPCGNELSGPFGIRLLGEAAHMQCVGLKQSSGLDVTVPSLCPIGPDAENDNICAGRGNLNPMRQCLPIALLVPDDVIGGKHSNDCVGILSQQ